MPECHHPLAALRGGCDGLSSAGDRSQGQTGSATPQGHTGRARSSRQGPSRHSQVPAGSWGLGSRRGRLRGPAETVAEATDADCAQPSCRPQHRPRRGRGQQATATGRHVAYKLRFSPSGRAGRLQQRPRVRGPAGPVGPRTEQAGQSQHPVLPWCGVRSGGAKRLGQNTRWLRAAPAM